MSKAIYTKTASQVEAGVAQDPAAGVAQAPAAISMSRAICGELEKLAVEITLLKERIAHITVATSEPEDAEAKNPRLVQSLLMNLLQDNSEYANCLCRRVARLRESIDV